MVERREETASWFHERVTVNALGSFAYAAPDVTGTCQQIVPNRYPFTRGRDRFFRQWVRGCALQEHLDGHAARAGHQLKLRVRVPGFDAICRIVASGIGVAVVSRTAALRCRRSMAIRVVPLTDVWALRRLRICVKSLRALPAHAQSLVEHLRFA